jgi:hypothetical protein
MVLGWHSFCMILGLVLLLLAGLRIPTPEHPRFSLGWFGIFFCFLSFLLLK